VRAADLIGGARGDFTVLPAVHGRLMDGTPFSFEPDVSVREQIMMKNRGEVEPRRSTGLLPQRRGPRLGETFGGDDLIGRHPC
jgi:hypothetical protein